MLRGLDARRVEGGGGLAGRADFAAAAGADLFQQLQDVAELELRDLDQREIADRPVRPVQHEEIREARDGQRQVGGRVVGPGLVELQAVAAADHCRADEAVGAETGGDHQYVQLVQFTVAGAHARCLDALDARGHQ